MMSVTVRMFLVLMAVSLSSLAVKANVVIIGADGTYPVTAETGMTWVNEGYGRLHVEQGAKILFNWKDEIHGVRRAKSLIDLITCKTPGIEDDDDGLLKEVDYQGIYLLDTSTTPADSHVYIFCPIQCHVLSTHMKLIIAIEPRTPCAVAKNEGACGRKSHCNWTDGFCTPALIDSLN
jgi:hypothetical protein